MNGLRLLIYGLNYAPEPTGTGKYTGEMAAWLAQRGHTVEAIVAPPFYPDWTIQKAYSGKRYYLENYQGVRVYRSPLCVPGSSRINARTRILMESSYSFFALRWWGPRFFHSDYDVVIAICPPLQMGVYPLLYKLLQDVPWVFHIQDLQVDAAVRLGILQARRFGRALCAMENFLLYRATLVSTITEAMRKRLLAKGVPNERTCLFPNWSDIKFVRPFPQNNDFRRQLGVNPKQLLLMYAGNMGEKQGLELVLQAANLLRSCSEVSFVLVGAGAARERLEIKAKEMKLTNVFFLPVQPLERLPEMLAAADIHMVVQKREAADIVMPSKLTNILAAGRPSVATADPGTTLYDVLDGYQAGLVTPPGDEQAFVAALLQLIESPDLRVEMGNNARNYAERYLNKEQILLEFETKLIDLVRKSEGGKTNCC